MHDTADVAPDTQRILLWETLRSAMSRPTILAAQAGGVVLLVAIQYFDASSTAKALLSSAIFVGLLVSPVVVTIIAVRQVRLNRALATLQAVSAAAWCIAGLSSGFGGFFLGVMISVPVLMSSAPLVTAIWQHNVPSISRGRMFGIATSVATVVGISSGLVIAWYMGDDASRYRPVMLGLGGLLLLGSVAAWQLPAQRLHQTVRNPVRLLSLLRHNPLFGYLSAVWMVLGFGNLASWPLRMEFIASGNYGMEYAPSVVLLLTLVLPQAVTLLATPVWGRVFDQTDFVRVRLAINALFIGSILLFFQPSIASQAAGSVLLGLGRGGGLVAWNLWVTKYAPPERTADYMSVHTFLTGTRGIVAPLLAYALLDQLPLLAVTRVSLVLLLTASLMLVPLLIRRGPAPATG